MNVRRWSGVEDEFVAGEIPTPPSMLDVSCEACRRRKAKWQFLPGSTQKKPRLSRKRKQNTDTHEETRWDENTAKAPPSNLGFNEDGFSMASDSRSTEGLAYLRPLASPKMPLSPRTTAATTVANRSDTATKPSSFGADPQNVNDNSESTSILNPQPAHPPLPAIDPLSGCMGESDAMLHTSHALSISPAVLQKLIDTYFSHMTTFSLFHRPTFPDKLKSMGRSLYLYALLASMCSFSARFISNLEDRAGQNPLDEEPSKIPCADHFHQVALRFEEESLTQCSDGTPPLEFLQAIILTTFFQLTKGVHGRAWRWLGTCIRVAYELNLHCIDSNQPRGYVPHTAAEIRTWTQKEERRRCWWAIWEMDCFASTIRRVPTGLSWKQSTTLLPVEDRFWYQETFHHSCLLAVKPGDRWKLLQRSGNESSAAWIIILISLSRNAQALSLSEGISPEMYDGDDQRSETGATTRSEDEELELISHHLQCTLLALPDSLQYHDEILRFASVDCNQKPVSSLPDPAKYTIYLLTELTKFMIAHYYTFNKGLKITDRPRGSGDMDLYEANSQPGILLVCTTRKPNVDGLKQYVEASDNIILLLNRCNSTHIRYVNPFLATTIWLAATVQLLNRKFGPSGASRDLAEARFNTLRLTYKQFARFWNTPAGLLQSLESLEERFDCLLGVRSRSTVDHVNSSSNHGESRSEKVFNFPETSVCFPGPYATRRKPSVSGTGCLTEPNLTGSGVNAMIGSSVQSSQIVDEQHEHVLQNFDSPVKALQRSGLPNGGGMESRPRQVDAGSQFDQGDSIDPIMDSTEFPFDFDAEADADLNIYLNNLLSGSYSGSLGPL